MQSGRKMVSLEDRFAVIDACVVYANDVHNAHNMDAFDIHTCRSGGLQKQRQKREVMFTRLIPFKG